MFFIWIFTCCFLYCLIERRWRYFLEQFPLIEWVERSPAFIYTYLLSSMLNGSKSILGLIVSNCCILWLCCRVIALKTLKYVLTIHGNEKAFLDYFFCDYILKIGRIKFQIMCVLNSRPLSTILMVDCPMSKFSLISHSIWFNLGWR